MGLDVVDVERVERLLERGTDRVFRRLLTEQEREYCVSKAAPAQHVAARIAAKEAAYKALQAGEGARAIRWRDMEVVSGTDGRPELIFHGSAKTTASRLQVKSALLSVTHSRSHAAAVVILLR